MEPRSTCIWGRQAWIAHVDRPASPARFGGFAGAAAGGLQGAAALRPGRASGEGAVPPRRQKKGRPRVLSIGPSSLLLRFCPTGGHCKPSSREGAPPLPPPGPPALGRLAPLARGSLRGPRQTAARLPLASSCCCACGIRARRRRQPGPVPGCSRPLGALFPPQPRSGSGSPRAAP